MTISNATFRRTERFLQDASLPSEGICTLITLALETQTTYAATAAPIIEFPLSRYALRLGLDRHTAIERLRTDNTACLKRLGFTLAQIREKDRRRASDLDRDFAGASLVVAPFFTDVIRGLGLERIDGVGLGLNLDERSADMTSLLGRIVRAGGGGVLYRQGESAKSRDTALCEIAATIAERLPETDVFLHRGREHEVGYTPIAAAILTAMLHQETAILVTTSDLVTASPHDDDDLDEEPATAKAEPGWSRLSEQGISLLDLLPHSPVTVLVPVARDLLLAPRDAARFATAIGPFRRDRSAALTAIQVRAGKRLADRAAGRLVDLWSAREDHAATTLHMAERMSGGFKTDADVCDIYSSAVEELMAGLAPHVWRPTLLQPKRANADRFFAELLVCEPDSALLLSSDLKAEPSLRILLTGVPGTGKSTVAEHVARQVLGLPTLDLKASDVLRHRLGDLERMISRAFAEARDAHAVLILDEVDSLAQNRATASNGAVHLVTALVNQLLVELDQHPAPIIFITNFGERLDPALKRRMDLCFEVNPIPDHLERRALALILGIDAPPGFIGFAGETTLSDYVNAKRVRRLCGGNDEAIVAAIGRARDVRLGRDRRSQQRIGF